MTARAVLASARPAVSFPMANADEVERADINQFINMKRLLAAKQCQR
jgi:hypothetical protein